MALINLGVRLSGLRLTDAAVEATERAIEVYRDLAVRNSRYEPELASALNNLSIVVGRLDRADDALVLIHEASEIYRRLAATNRAFLPDLAMALNNCAVALARLERREEATQNCIEALDLYRALASANPALRKDYASAAGNAAQRLNELERWEDSVAYASEMVDTYRTLVVSDSAAVPALAEGLTELGGSLAALGRGDESLSVTQEAVDLLHGVATGDPTAAGRLASTMATLDDRLREFGRPHDVQEAWASARAGLDPQAGAVLALRRSETEPAGAPQSAGWLQDALANARPRGLVGALHEEARRHFAADPDGWPAELLAADSPRGGLPGWLVVDASCSASARRWINTPTFEAEAEFLARNQELLGDTADVAVSEALLEVDEDEEERYLDVRAAAREVGVDAAYRPRLLAVLATVFATADPDEQRRLLETDLARLRSDEVHFELSRVVGSDEVGDSVRAQIALSHHDGRLRGHRRSGDKGSG